MRLSGTVETIICEHYDARSAPCDCPGVGAFLEKQLDYFNLHSLYSKMEWSPSERVLDIDICSILNDNSCEKKTPNSH